MDRFFSTQQYLIDRLDTPLRRQLMDEIDWSHRLIGIKGSRGVGKTTFLLQYARQCIGNNHNCLYINLNDLYFTVRSIVDFADEFRKKGGQTLLIDQVFKYPNWSSELRYCYDNFTDLNIVFTGSSVMRLHEENPDLNDCVHSYNLRGFSFREYVNLATGSNLRSYKLSEIIENHETIAGEIVEKVRPYAHFDGYLNHGYYPFFLEKRNFSGSLLKFINITMEIDILSLKQIDLKYLPKIRKLLYLLAGNAPVSPNVSQLSNEIETSRATVMNYIKYLKEARMFNLLYAQDEVFPKKPAKVYMQNCNLMYAIQPSNVTEQGLRETFLYNNLQRDNKVNESNEGAHFLVEKKYHFSVYGKDDNFVKKPQQYYAVDMLEVGQGNMIPLWLFGFLY